MALDDAPSRFELRVGFVIPVPQRHPPVCICLGGAMDCSFNGVVDHRATSRSTVAPIQAASGPFDH